MIKPRAGGPYRVHSPEIDDNGVNGPYFMTVNEARHWVIDHLDQSLNPEIVRCGSTRDRELKGESV